LATVFAGILIASRVAGFHHIRALPLEKTNFAIPGMVNDPAFLTSETAMFLISSRMIAPGFLDDFSTKKAHNFTIVFTYF
jgi:hypothetical protein